MSIEFPQRPREHQLADESTAFFLQNLPRGWTCDRPQNDYGVDLRVGLAEDGRVNAQQLIVQLKATESAGPGESVPLVLNVTTLNYLRDMLEVALVVKYVAADKEAYWLLLKDFTAQPRKGQKTVTIRLPRTNRLTDDPWDRISAHIQAVHYKKLAANTSEGIVCQGGEDQTEAESVDAPSRPDEVRRSNSRSPHSREPSGQRRSEPLIDVEVRLNRNFDSFTAQEQEILLSGIRALLGTSSTIRISAIARGSIVLTLQLTRRDGLFLIVLHHLGRLRQFGAAQVAPVGGSSLSLDEALAASVADSPDPPRSGRRERGRIVFLDEAAGVGIVERTRGGFVRFPLWHNLPKNDASLRQLPPQPPTDQPRVE
jgi:hypothetical protein